MLGFAERRPRTFGIRTKEQIERLLDGGELTIPFVVKPADHAGSVGVTIVDDRRATQDTFRHASERRHSLPYGREPDPRLVVQQYVAGEEFSVESVTQRGASQHVCITRKLTTKGAHRTELGHSVPADLDSATMQRILAETDRALDAVGIVNGVSHTEVIVEAGGRCVIVETGARIPGIPIGELVSLAVGVDLSRAAVDIALGRPVRIARTCEQCATAHFSSGTGPAR
jgi:biotin carboxylase